MDEEGPMAWPHISSIYLRIHGKTLGSGGPPGVPARGRITRWTHILRPGGVVCSRVCVTSEAQLFYVSGPKQIPGAVK